MTSKNLEEVMSACGVDPATASQLISAGWTIQSFAFSALDLEAFDKLWPEFFSEEPTLLQKASLRAAFRMCHDLTQPAPANQTPVGGTGASDASASAGTWAESFPPKLDTAVIEQMKSKFLASYPSELINHDTMPSTRLLSLTHHQLTKKQWSWIPWKYRLTLTKSDEITSQRQAKMPKLEVATLHHLLVDEPPSIDISNAGFGVNAVRNLLAVHDMAVAMCGGAHLANLKAYSAKFLSFLTQRVDPDTMLRCASITEAQAADRQIWASISDLMSEREARLFLDICSGATRPLSAAILAQQGNVLSFDILLDKRMDLLHDQSYEQLLRICSSGQAPKHFEHLKLWMASRALTAWSFYKSKSLLCEYLSRQTACYPPALAEAFANLDNEEPPLSAHLTNWQSAEDDIALTRELVQQEIDKGCVTHIPFA
ncbi:unnamed protein product [Cladocopium goreaui]|uniref:C3H1-type domain-containing protein n=1 Tax=Cladocopium goreaui TaxID=2562237 RepID=A0A9P1CVR3_9DINO|nr:unnamed protein product [Cladocopium goreaui]